MATHAFKFDPPKPSEDGNDEVSIEINGELFQCIPRSEVSGLDLLCYTAGMDIHLPISARARTLIEWLERVVIDYDRFDKTLRELGVDIEGTADISRVIADAYSERPTQPADSSTGGQQTTGDSSEESSS